jgi:hypothetical protein
MSSVTFSTGVGGDGSTVTDDNNATTGLREGGWKTRFVPCFTQQVAVANYVVSAATSVLGGATTNSTSTTSLSIATGSKSLTLVESGKAYIVGQYVIIASTASPSNNMIGQITSFSGTSLVVNVTTINGSGTISAWSISVTASASQTVDGTNPIGYKNIPQTGSDKTTAYTLVAGDVGKYVGVGTGGSIVVPTSTFANGDAISVFNNTTGNITITTSAPTAYIGGTNTVKTSITLATRGIATILFVSATTCVVTGNVS